MEELITVPVTHIIVTKNEFKKKRVKVCPENPCQPIA